MLPAQVGTVSKSGDLGKGIPLIRLLQCSCQQVLLLHRLRSHTGIDTGATQEQKLLASVLIGAVDHVHLHHHVFIKKISRSLAVRHDTSDLARRHKYIIRLL